MAKNSQIYSANSPYGNRDEEIRKAKGNPNKNTHAKKKNSNYGGYNGAAEKARKAAEEESTLNKLPTWMKVTLIVDIVVIVVLLILRLGVLKNNAPLSYITTLFLGLSCALADARHLHQLLARGEEHPLKRAEAVEQRMGQLVRVAPRDGVVEQQLQHLVLREAVQSVAGEALLHALAVPVVQTHADPSFRSVGSGQRFSGTGCRCPWRPCRYRGWPSASE